MEPLQQITMRFRKSLAIILETYISINLKVYQQMYGFLCEDDQN